MTVPSRVGGSRVTQFVHPWRHVWCGRVLGSVLLLLAGAGCEASSSPLEVGAVVAGGDVVCRPAPLRGASPDSPLGFLFAFYHGAHDPSMPPPDLSTIRPLDDPPYSIAYGLGSRWERVSEPILNWTFVQRDAAAIRDGSFDWSIPDNFLLQIPPEIQILANLSPGDARLVDGAWAFPNPMLDAAFRTFVERAVERYDGDGVDDAPGLVNPVKHWQLDNEPVTKELRSGACTPSGGRSPEDCLNTDHAGYAALLRGTVEAAIAADPEATVLPGGVFSVPSGDIDDFVFESFWAPLLADLSGFPLHGFDLHSFGAWDALPDRFRRYRAALDAAGFDATPIWMTEIGSPSHIEGERWQAADHARRFALALGLGARKVFRAWALVEGWPPFDCASVFEYTGLVHDGRCDDDPGWGVPKLGYFTYALFARQIADVDPTAVTLLEEGSDGVYVVRFPGHDGRVSWLAWSASGAPQNVTLDVGASACVTFTESVPWASSGADIPQGIELTGLEALFVRRSEAVVGGTVTFEVQAEPVFVEVQPPVTPVSAWSQWNLWLLMGLLLGLSGLQLRRMG